MSARGKKTLADKLTSTILATVWPDIYIYLSIEDFKNDDDDDGDGDDGHYLCSKELLDPAGTL